MAARRDSTRSRRPRSLLDLLLTGTGELLITAGLVVALFLSWQLWWTGIAADKIAGEQATAFASTQVTSPMTEGTRHTEDPPSAAQGGYGETLGMLIIPKWYGYTNNNMPILEGTGKDVLDESAAGHYVATQQVGEVGNFALAGHRRTNGNSFRRIDLLNEGDEVVVATKDTWYVYAVTGHEIVDPSAVEVVAPVPKEPGRTPTERYLTLTTCHSLSVGEWGNDHRWVTWARLSYWMPRSEGRPASVLSNEGVS